MGCDLVPVPVLCEAKEGVFELGPGMSVQASAGLEKEAALLAGWLSGIEGVGQVGISRAPVANAATSISLSIDPGMQRAEEYELGIAPQGIRIAAKDAAGIVRGAATLWQLALSQGRTLRSLRIQDWPRFAWRGFMLDCARNFFRVEFIEKLLDLAALHKLNVFHWHLTDDQAWRLE
ncbi:MAG: family 20 glycosylhydrolase, partial [Spirochaetia bacterium]|nr:family 20 glycosylhydrolase [Spirochaetia bacterium]